MSFSPVCLSPVSTDSFPLNPAVLPASNFEKINYNYQSGFISIYKAFIEHLTCS